MELLQSWQESLALLKPKNLKLFLLVMLKAFIETWSILLRKFWWLLLILVLINKYGLIVNFGPVLAKLKFLEDLIIFSLLWLLILLVARPSVTKKQFSYFWQHIPLLIINLLVIIGIGIVLLCYLDNLVLKFLFSENMILHLVDIVLAIFMMPFIPLFVTPMYLLSFFLPIDYCMFFASTFLCTIMMIFFSLFLFDRLNIISAIRRAAIMVLYNYPLLLFCSVITTVSLLIFPLVIHIFFEFALWSLLHNYLNALIYVYELLGIITFSFHLCFLTNFYTKQIHEKPQWYL